MLYLITTSDGLTHELDLPVTDSISWQDFLRLKQIQALGQEISDVTPKGMPDHFTDEEQRLRQLANMGLRQSKTEKGLTEYEEIDPSLDLN